MNKSIKTKKQVSKTLIKLLNYKPLDLITIKELTEKANISRTAFYNNFHTLEDVLKYICLSLYLFFRYFISVAYIILAH